MRKAKTERGVPGAECEGTTGRDGSADESTGLRRRTVAETGAFRWPRGLRRSSTFVVFVCRQIVSFDIGFKRLRFVPGALERWDREFESRQARQWR